MSLTKRTGRSRQSAVRHHLDPIRASAGMGGASQSLGINDFEFVLGSIGDAVFLVDEHACLSYANEAFYQFFEIQSNAPPQLALPALIEWTPEGWTQRWSELEAHGCAKFGGRTRTHNGHLMSFEANARLVSHNGVGHALVVVRNVGGRQPAVDETLAREHMISSVLENSPDIIVRYDLQFRRIYANSRFEQLYGITPEEYLGKKPSDTGHLDSGLAQQLEEGLAAALHSGQPQELDVEWLAPDGRLLWHSLRIVVELDASDCPGSLLCIASDITARKQAEQAQAASEREFRLLAENSPDCIARYDRLCRAVYLNRQLLSELPLGTRPQLGLTPTQTMPGGTAEVREYEDHLWRVLQTGEPSEMEMHFVQPSGEAAVHHIRFAAVEAAKGEVESALAIGRDITDRKRAEEVLRLREQEFRVLVEQSPDLIERYDRQGQRIYANPALRALLHDGAAMSDKPEHGGMVVIEADHYRNMLQTVLATGSANQAELRFQRADGSVGWLDARLCPGTDSEGNVASVFVIARDITQSVEQREHIKALALSDPLTRLHNRQALYEYAPGLISEARRHGRMLGMMILDVDHFKDVNDTLGHPAGDSLLCVLAQRIADCTRGYDLLARLGGDEFAIIAINLDDEFSMARIAEKINKALAAPLHIGGRQVVVSASIGIALFPADGDHLEDLMGHADAAMYHAKHGGRGRYEFYHPEFSERVHNRLALEHTLRDAQDGDGLELHYQPLVDLSDGRVVGAEALLRWRHPVLGPLAPDRFVSIAEDTGLIVPIGRWVIDQAARSAWRWNQGRATPLKVAVNVSTRQFLRDDIADVVRKALARTGCQPQWLSIEVTESLLAEDSERIQRTFRELQAIGLQIAIDDFGTGYSALNYLAKFDVNCLKIDRQFVRDIDSDPRQAELVKAFIGIARALNLSVVAEGVESPAQAKFLLAHGCDVGQGYLFCRPATEEYFERELRDRHWEQDGRPAGAICAGDEFASQIDFVEERAADDSAESVLAIGRDIGARVETQRQLSMLIEGHADVFMRHDCDGRVVYVSPASARRFGFTQSECVGRTMADLDDRYGSAFHESVRRVADTGLLRRLELPFAVVGELRYWEVRHVPEIGELGRVTGVLGIARDITKRRQNEETIRELQQLHEAAREEERRYIARELHDEMGQHLSALRMEVSLLRMRCGGLDPALREKTEGLQAMVDHMIQITRNLVSSLRPAVLDIGIASALEWLVEELRGRSDVSFRLRVDDAADALDSGRTMLVFRIVQEALTNVVRHAQAKRVDVTLERRGADYMLMVRDDGHGFDPETRPRRSLGLVGLQERAQMLGGRLDVRSAPGAGTMISVSFPAAG